MAGPPQAPVEPALEPRDAATEAGYTSLERQGARPTCEVNGFYSGFIGEGAKTIVPAYAKAKIYLGTFR